MTIKRLLLVSLAGALTPAAAQEPLWQLTAPPGTPPGPGQSIRRWHNLAEFRDFDGDGVRDFLVRATDNWPSNYFSTIEIRSGRTSEVLWSITLPGPIDVRDAGDCDGDGWPEVLLLYGGSIRRIQLWSTRTTTVLWTRFSDPSANGYQWGTVLQGDMDLNGDGLKDVLVGTIHAHHSTVYAYTHTGTLLWSIDYRAQGRFAYSASRYGDFNGDGCDDFLLGLQGDPTGRGIVAICSGADGSYLQQSLGVRPLNYLCDHVRNVGDIDGDGVHDYAGFPAWFTYTGDCAIFSGATGSVLRTWIDYAESVVAGPGFDLDRDGVPDLLICNEQTVAPNTKGQARALSGRDGALLWKVDALPYYPGSPYYPGAYGWGRFAVPLGTWPDRAYPSLAWIELDWQFTSTTWGRVRAFGGEHVGQGAVRGSACSSSASSRPLIGARTTASGARVTLAQAPPGAFAVLVMSLQHAPTFGPHGMPLDLSPLGLPGCMLQVIPDVAHWRITGTGPGHDAGYAAVDLPFPLTGATTGTKVYAQWLALDITSGAFAATEVQQLRGQ
jgi:hypothetical protein